MLLFNKMKSGDKVRIVKVCWPFVKMDLLGKVSEITIRDDGSIYLVGLKKIVNKDWIELVYDDAVDEIDCIAAASA